MIRHIFLITFVLSILITQADTEGYELKVSIKNLANREIILGYHFNKQLIPVDTLKLDKDGFGIFQEKTKLPEGIYFIVTPSRAMFDIFMTENQHYSIETDTLNLLGKMRFEGSPENVSAWEYLKFIKLKQKEAFDFQEIKKKLTNENDIKSIDYQIKKIGLDVKDSARSVIQKNQNNFVGIFIRATQEIDIPDPPKNSEGKIIDPNFQYWYYRSHYFDNFNIADVRLLRTPIYEDKVKLYLDKVVPQISDTLNSECDKLLNRAENDKEVFGYMLITLFNRYLSSEIMGHDAVYAHIAEKWFIPKATFSDTAFINQTAKAIEILKPVLIGKPAPELKMLRIPTEHFIQAKTDTLLRDNLNDGSLIDLYSIQSNFTIILFWESDCDRCLREMPELYEIYKKIKNKGVEVMAVHGLSGVEGKRKWIKFVNEHEMYDWLNVYNPNDHSYNKTYNVFTTPWIIILDKNKKIIGKRIKTKLIEEFIDDRIKQQTP